VGPQLKWLAASSQRRRSSFRLYDAELVRGSISGHRRIRGGFRIAVKAWMAGRRIAEVPSTWRDRVAGESRFDLRRWLPTYGRLWLAAMRHGLRQRVWS
jgi:hypothetical protein